jgi:hypothetical protein
MLITLAFLALGCTMVGTMAWLERRPRQGLKTSLLPTTPIMFAGFFVALVAAVHIVNLLGVHTGR